MLDRVKSSGVRQSKIYKWALGGKGLRTDFVFAFVSRSINAFFYIHVHVGLHVHVPDYIEKVHVHV